MDFQHVKEQDKQYIMNTYGRFDACIVKGKGAICTDINGKEYVDFTSGIGVNSLGFADESWVKAVTEQAGNLAHISNLYYTCLLYTSLPQMAFIVQLDGADHLHIVRPAQNKIHMLAGNPIEVLPPFPSHSLFHADQFLDTHLWADGEPSLQIMLHSTIKGVLRRA